MAFDKRDSAKIYKARDGDDLIAIAERETAFGNTMTWQELAQFNWGTCDPEQVDELLRDELGCRKRGADKQFVFADDDRPHNELRIPSRFSKDGLALNRTHQVRVNRKDCPEQFLGCCSFPSLTFGFNSSFIRPTVIDHLRTLETLAQARPDARIMVFGHTDAVGEEIYNKKLSERRAWSAHAFVINDPDAWETLYNHADEHWGLATLKEILAYLGHDPGPIDGAMNSATRNAMAAFLSLPDGEPVANDAAFRKALFAAYMGGRHDIDVPADRFLEPGYQGCGEFNPISDTKAADEANRRVTFYFFHPDRLPTLPCGFADVAPCKRQMVSLETRHTDTFRCSFYDSIAKRCPAEDPISPVADELIFAEVCEVVTNGKQTELRPPVDSREQYVNLDREVEPDALRPEYGRMICLKARVAWKSGKSSDLAGHEVLWFAEYELAQRNDLRQEDRPGFHNPGADTSSADTTTDADGWTPVVEYFLSTYGGEESALSARLVSTGADMAAGTYTVWKKLWYQVTEMDRPPSKRFRLGSDVARTFENIYADVSIRIEEAPKSGNSGRKVVPYAGRIDQDSRHDLGRTFFEADNMVPFKAHIVMVDKINSDKDYHRFEELMTAPVWQSPHSFVLFKHSDKSKPWLWTAKYRVVGREKWRNLPRRRVKIVKKVFDPKKSAGLTPLSTRHYIRVDFSKAVLKPGPGRKVEISLGIRRHEILGVGGDSQHALIALGRYGIPLKKPRKDRLAHVIAHEVGHTLGLLNRVPAGLHDHDAWRDSKTGHCDVGGCTMSYSGQGPWAGSFHIDTGTKAGCADYLRRQDFSRSSMTHWNK